VSPNINAKKGVKATGATAKLRSATDIEKSIPGFSGTPFNTTNMAKAVDGVTLTPSMVMANVVCTPLNTKVSNFRYWPIGGWLPK
jgi:hypothetical protein